MKRNPDNPSTTFFWNDWDNEPGIKFCSLAAQGLWVRMLSLAARSREHGVVLIGAHPSTREDLPALLASSCGESVETICVLVDQLITFKVAAVDDAGRVFNRRMVAEAKISAERSAAGKKGADATNGKRQKSGKGVGKRVGKHSGNNVGKTSDGRSSANVGRPAKEPGAPTDGPQQNGGNPVSNSSASSFFTLSSVSKDTGAGAPINGGIQASSLAATHANIDKAKVTFGACLDYLTENGVAETNARSQLGRWRKNHGDDAVHAAVDRARDGSISEPVAFITKILQAGGLRRQQPRADGWEAQP